MDLTPFLREHGINFDNRNLRLGTMQAPPPKKGSVPYSIRYSLPADGLTQPTIDGKPEVMFGVGVIALNRDGRAIETHASQVTMRLNGDEVRANPGVQLAFDQQLNLKNMTSICISPSGT